MEFVIFTYLLLALVSLFGYLYLLLKRRFDYWKNLKVPYIEPQSYVFGQDKKVATGELSMAENQLEVYKKLAPHKYGGIFFFQNPAFIVRDPELIKHVLTKDFAHFYDRSMYFDKPYESLTRHLFNLTGEQWKTIRAKLTPTFSTGKLKLMFAYVKECVDELISVVDERQDEEIEMKDLMARYTVDVISSCAFGLRTNSLRNPDAEFKRMGVQALAPTAWTRVKNILVAIAPRLVFFLKIRTFDDQVTEFFHRIVRETVQYREENNVTRNDFLHQALQLRNQDESEAKKESSEGITLNEKSVELTLDIITAQCFVIFLGGFETSSSALSFTLFQLSQNPHVQQKLQEDVDRVFDKYNDEITYDALQEMTYADMVIHETLRKYPAIPFLVRTCTEDYKIPDTDTVIKRGTWTFVPIYGLHHDPAYFSNPDDFYPEHFTEEAIKSRPHYTYLPFGEGPRICIGIRLGLMQVKLALVSLIRNYSFSLSPNMKLPMTFEKHTVLTHSENGILVVCTKRNHESKDT
ncbi:probable cytochrome P450 6a14 [Planococcus citri]|uniref:probable cytochrome P450 6a14 n=1 Tax=Planococcus citri TaxID=170843 RepID=UPI0031F7A2AC